MNDLKTLADLGAELDPPQAAVPARIRHRVLTGITEQPRRTMPRYGWRLAGAGGLAVALTAGVLATQVVSFGDHAPASSAQAAQILEAAAAHAAAAPAVPVAGDQFIYVDALTTSASMKADGSGPVTVESRQHRVWYSVDGSRDGLRESRPRPGTPAWKKEVLPGCHNGKTLKRKGERMVEAPCEPPTAYRGNLPADADHMFAYLYQDLRDRNPRDQQAFTKAGDTIREVYLPPASLSAMFGALARIPGVTVAGNVTDESGRAGVAVALTTVQGSREELIFDRTTHAYLGERDVQVSNGQVLNSTAILTVTVVDKAGQLP